MDSVREELLAQFVAITQTSSVDKAETYLTLTEWNLEQAIEIFFANDGADLSSTVGPSTSASASAPPPAPPVPITTTTSTTQQPPLREHQGRTSSDAISIDDDDEDEDMETVRAVAAAAAASPAGRSGAAGDVNIYEDDEAMARRLQEELYAEAGNSGGGARNTGSSWREEDLDGVRAPMARTTETLVGPDEDHFRRLAEHRLRTMGRPQGRGPVGIFNQRVPDDPMAFGDSDNQSAAERRRALARATNGASAVSSRASRLAELYTPPFEIMTRADFSSARDIGKERLKWLMVNIQDGTVFDSQVLNRDIWKDPAIRSTIQENFIFLQYTNDSVDGLHYVNLYLSNRYPVADYPHIGIVDPRTGELLKSWSRVPDKNEFLLQLYEFLERYSLDPSVKMPVQQKPKEKTRGVEQMTEDEMMQFALQQSLGVAGTAGESGDSNDPDMLTKKEGKQKAGKEDDLIDLDEEVVDAPATDAAGGSTAEPVSVFASIAKNKHHSEPPANAPGVTRVQFRLPDGSRVVRRFALADKVERVFEYVKADLLPEQATKSGNEELADKEFELKSLGKNLIDHLEASIDETGLKMATIMVDIES